MTGPTTMLPNPRPISRIITPGCITGGQAWFLTCYMITALGMPANFWVHPGFD